MLGGVDCVGDGVTVDEDGGVVGDVEVVGDGDVVGADVVGVVGDDVDGSVVGDSVEGVVDGSVVGDDVEGVVVGGVVVGGWARAPELVVKTVAAKTNTAVAVKRAALRCGYFIFK